MGDIVKARHSVSRKHDRIGVLLEIIKDTTYPDVDRYFGRYVDIKTGKPVTQWMNHIEVLENEL